MIDKHEEIRKYIRDNDRRISEQEELMKDIIDDIPKFSAKKWDESYHSINHFIGKVGELEGKYKALLNGIEILNERISELKEHWTRQQEDLDNQRSYYGRHNQIIDELKERVDFLLDLELQAKETDYIITEVLRELILLVKQESNIDTPLVQNIEYDKLLEKLDVGSASARESLDRQTVRCRNLDKVLCPDRECPCEAFEPVQTEKKDIGNKYIKKDIKDFKLDEPIIFINPKFDVPEQLKASGGEKPICPECEADNNVYPLSNGLWHCGDCNVDIENDSDGEKEIDWCLKEAMSSKSSPYIPLDSKPPEPTHEDDLKEILDTDMPITILAHIKKRVRDATRQEPREDDWNQNSFILVKREDLERWKKEFEKSGHPEWEYIEEEYGIE